ncbi:MAG: hypothetical protein ACKOKG_01875, partial [Verrucomicrobiota bacterium]|jgi:hypothetical protein
MVVSHFSAELAALIERQFEGSQLKFGRAVGIDQSMVSRQCAGVSLPDRATVQRFTRALSETQSIPLVVAYLRDHCPESLRSQICIRAKSPAAKARAGESLKIDLAGLPTRQRTLIRQFTDLMVSDPRATAFLSAALRFVNEPGVEK